MKLPHLWLGLYAPKNKPILSHPIAQYNITSDWVYMHQTTNIFYPTLLHNTISPLTGFICTQKQTYFIPPYCTMQWHIWSTLSCRANFHAKSSLAVVLQKWNSNFSQLEQELQEVAFYRKLFLHSVWPTRLGVLMETRATRSFFFRKLFLLYSTVHAVWPIVDSEF